MHFLKNLKWFHNIDVVSLPKTLNEGFRRVQWAVIQYLPGLGSSASSPLEQRLLRKQWVFNETALLQHPHFHSLSSQPLWAGRKIPASFGTPSSFYDFKWPPFPITLSLHEVPGAERCNQFNISFCPFTWLIGFSRSTLPQFLPSPIHVCILHINLIFLQAKDHTLSFPLTGGKKDKDKGRRLSGVPLLSQMIPENNSQ